MEIGRRNGNYSVFQSLTTEEENNENYEVKKKRVNIMAFRTKECTSQSEDYTLQFVYNLDSEAA